MKNEPHLGFPAPVGPGLRPAAAVIAVTVLVCAAYANLSLVVTNKADLRFFPPFRANDDANRNFELGGENYEIARSLVAGRGFASPFKEPSGPTAWMPPVLPFVEAGLVWACDGNRDAVMAVAIVLQLIALIVTGFFLLALTRQTAQRVGPAAVAALFLLALVSHFMWWFQRTHDSWLVLLTLDGLIAGACWWRPLARWRTAAGWGLLGGLSALVSPVVGFTWAALSVAVAGHCRAWRRLAGAALVAGLTLTPWAVRNGLVFGRLIPVKSNLAYELYQSQCLQPDGLLQQTTQRSHPYQTNGRERQEYKALGEVAFMDRKRQEFGEAVRADPLNFAARVGDRFLGATLWYVPFDRAEEARRPAVLWARRLIHPLPFLAVVLLLAPGRPGFSWPRAVGIVVYGSYLLPYVVASYYERYAVPLLAVKVLLVVWGADRLIPYRLSSSPSRRFP
jgi:hypothetical protein